MEGGREWFKIASEAHSGGVMRAADEDAGAMAFAVGTEHGGHRVPGGAGGRDGCRDPAGPGDAVSPGVPGGPSDLADPRGPSTAGESSGTASAIPQIPGAPQAPGPVGDAAPRVGVLSNQALQSSLTMPFSLLAQVEIPGLFLQLTTEDSGLLQTSIAFCLEQLSLVIRILQHFVLPLFAKSQHRRGA
ncbi:hypothetical protein FD754_022879 [Muntiacus muntjak]|uniref:Uncharacterized protein n=1 Tax=Muntiacus muntjak TaxID=9888 RepID=A0A5N3UVF0_MUNMU|nr:hypothetical protein FD754_022879 [Muntiacus muntjak]